MPLHNNAKPLPPKFSDAYRDFGYQISKVKDSPLEAIRGGKLKMYAVKESTEFIDISDTLGRIEDAYQAFKKICEKPISHLKAINEVKPIETVKRVGYESIPYLASHSEDWLAITAKGLKPKRLFSRAEDDDFQIYENRFVKTALDWTCNFLSRNRTDLQDKLNNIKDILDSGVQTDSFGFDKGFAQAVNELINKQNNVGYENLSKKVVYAEKLYIKTTYLWKKYQFLHQSKLYKYLRGAKNVTKPINETNILLMEKSYNVIFELWKYIQKPTNLVEKDIVNPEDLTEQRDEYRLFCNTLCEYAAYRMNFKQMGKGVFRRDSDDIKIFVNDEDGNITVAVMDDQKRELEIAPPLECPRDSYENFEYKNQILYWNNETTEKDIDDYCRLFKRQESRGKQQAEEQARYNVLKKAILDKHKQYGVPKVYKIKIFPSFCDVKDDNQTCFSDSMKNDASVFLKDTKNSYAVIALPKCEKNEKILTTYANNNDDEKIAFLPLTMFDINSYRRLQLLFLKLIVNIIGKKDKCPYCGDKMRDINASRAKCTSCGLRVTETICDKPDCNHKFVYLDYEVSQEILDKMKCVEPDDFYAKDSLFKYKNIVELSFNKTIEPLCPKCQITTRQGNK
ncbi:MAG: DUF2357 domain-containing protein [Deferribacteraceae bacterium]|jgi:hypothetical protein|nr:DUF2357 domain-containing protein [Deferribacteraceae bacterium]